MALVNGFSLVNDVTDASVTQTVSRPAGSSERYSRSSSSEILSFRPVDMINIGTWNVRTMLKAGKLENVKEEMRRMKLNIMGLCETRWKGRGDFISYDTRVIYSGGQESQRGVAILLDEKSAKCVKSVNYISDRILGVRINAKPTDLFIIQVYMPTSNHSNEEVAEMYEKIESIISSEKGKIVTIVMGDWNAVVGEGRDGQEVGNYGLGHRNDRGEDLVEFCKQQRMCITNTWFKHHKRQRYTWKQPGDGNRYQIDYIMIKQRYRNSIKDARSYSGPDADTDHNMVMIKMRVKFKKVMKGKMLKKWNLTGLKNDLKCMNFRDRVDMALCNDLEPEQEQTDINNTWRQLKEAITASAEQTIGYNVQKRIRKPWVTQEMLDKMNERRKWKNITSDEGKRQYRKLNNQLRRETDKAKELWWKEQCDTLEKFNRENRSDQLYRKIKEITRKAKGHQTNSLKSKDGKLLTTAKEIRDRWKEYLEDLYTKEEKPDHIAIEECTELCEDDIGPRILKSEIEAAINEMKYNKAAGIDNIPVEFLKNLGKTGRQKLMKLCQEIYDKGKWPNEFTESIVIPIEKKAGATECSDFRTLSLIPHAAKIVLKILTKRLYAKSQFFIGEDQYGFRRGCGTREAIAGLRMICDRSMEHGEEVFICYVDYEKAFDRVNWIKMMEILHDIGVDWRDRRLIAELYMNQSAYVRFDGEFSKPAIIGRGNRQGCPLSPILYIIYDEALMKEAFRNVNAGITVGGRTINSLRFADDKAILASNEEGLQELMTRLNDVSEEYGMKINTKKTKVMHVSRKRNVRLTIQINRTKIEQVQEFKYLGSIMTENGSCDKEIKTRIALGKLAFKERQQLLTSKLNRVLKKRIIKCLIWSITLYGAETWTMKKATNRRLEAFEMWLWRRMEKISWTQRKTNVQVLEQVEEERALLKIISNRKKTWLGHIMRQDHSLLLDLIEGRMEGKNMPGRRRFNLLSDLFGTIKYVMVKHAAQDRSAWKEWNPKTSDLEPASFPAED